MIFWHNYIQIKRKTTKSSLFFLGEFGGIHRPSAWWLWSDSTSDYAFFFFYVLSLVLLLFIDTCSLSTNDNTFYFRKINIKCVLFFFFFFFFFFTSISLKLDEFFSFLLFDIKKTYLESPLTCSCCYLLRSNDYQA